MPEKRKKHTSTDVKRRYNEKVYSRINFSAPKDLVAEFKAKCESLGVSQARVLRDAMQEFIECTP